MSETQGPSPFIAVPSHHWIFFSSPLCTAALADQRSMLTFSWQQTISQREHNMRRDTCSLPRYDSGDQRASCPWSQTKRGSTWLQINTPLTVAAKTLTTKPKMTKHWQPLKEQFDILGILLNRFLADSYMWRLTPLSCLHGKYEATGSSQVG